MMPAAVATKTHVKAEKVKAKVSEKKLRAVEELAALIEDYPVVGLADLTKMPAAQLQQIRAVLRGKALIRMTKKAVINFALQKSKRKLVELTKIESTEPALILSKISAFELQRLIASNRSEAAAKAGDIAPADLTVPAGKTNLPPGPAISELQKVGLKAAIKGPNIEILEPKTLVKIGEKVTAEAAGVLNKLGIKPMQLELILAAAWEDGLVFGRDILTISPEQWVTQIQAAYKAAFNLAYNADYLTVEIAPFKIGEAFRNAFNLAVEAKIFTKESTEIFIAQAQAQALALSKLVPAQ